MNKETIWPAADRRAMLALEGRHADPADTVDLGRLLRGVRRQAWVVGLGAAVGLVFAVVTLATTQPLYTAHSAILLDAERAELLDLVSELPSAIVGDSSVQSEIEIVKSRELALRVVDRLDLVASPVPLTTPPSLIDQAVEGLKDAARAVLSLVEPADEEAAVAAAAAEVTDPRLALALTLRNHLTVERVGRSYVFVVSYTAPAPDLAAEITNAYADAYLDYQLEANASSGEAAAEWLRGRVDVLREASLQASRELERFRRENNVVSVGERLLSEQQASELMSQLILAEADASRAEALARQAEAAVAGGADAAARNLTATGEGIDDVTASLLADYTAAERQRRRVADEFGAEHPEAQRLAGEIARLEALIYDALERRLTAARNAAEAAESRVSALRSGLQTALQSNQTEEGVTSRLAQLQQTDESYRQIYRDYLTRLEQAVQRQSVPIVAARVISAADVPEGASYPSKAKVLAVGLFLGVFAGAGIGTLRELRRDRLDGPDDVERLAGVRPIATLPRMPRWRALGGGVAAGRSWRRKSRALPGKEVDADVAKALRAVKLALDDAPGRRPGRTVGISSARRGEGRTTLAILLGTMLARHGFSTAVVDASDGTLARTFGTPETADLVSLSRDGQPDFEALPRTGPDPLAILRLSPEADPAAGILLSGTRTMSEMFDRLGEAFDYVILDLPALSEGRDATALSRHLDTAVIVNRPGFGRATEVAALAADLSTPSVSGVVLNVR